MNLELVIQSEVSQKERQILYINAYIWTLGGFPCGSAGKESTCNAGDLVWSLGWEDPLEKGKATYSSILAWRIPGTAEPGGLPSMGLHRVGHV